MAEHEKLLKDADSRLKGIFGKVTHPKLVAERTYCFMCGKPHGWTTMDSSQFAAPAHIVVSCDDCDAKILSTVAGPDAYGLKAVPTWLFDAYGIIPEESAKVPA